jgi:hypothetical protein
MKDITRCSGIRERLFRRYGMENIIAVVAVILFLAGLLLFAKRFLKAPKGKLPDCCGPRGNRDIEV